ncbi:hypothetical protein PHBOTO_000816 [Pseudozyma hubeiensis]|nr:hypothetical protein PHBOTO_000816 [Pseudozyma hubeiensis]
MRILKLELLRFAVDVDVVELRSTATAVSQLRAERRPKDGHLVVVRLGSGQRLGYCTTVVRGDVPVLDPRVVRSACRSSGNVTDGENVAVSLDAELRVDGDSSVLLELEAGIFEEVGGGSYTNTEDDNVGSDRFLLSLAVLDDHRCGSGRLITFDLFDTGFHVELEAVLDLRLHQTLTHFLAEHTLEGDLLHTDHRDIGALCQSDGRFHADEGRSDDDDVLALLALVAVLVADCLVDRLGIADLAQYKNILEVRARDGDAFRDTSGSQHELLVFQRRSVLQSHRLGVGIDFGDAGVLQLDAEHVIEVRLASPRYLVGIGDERLAELGAVYDSLFVRYDGDATLVAALSQLLDTVDGTGTTANDDNALALGDALSSALAARRYTWLAFELLGVGSDEKIVAFDIELEAEDAVEGRGVLDLAVLGVEAGTVPGANDASISGEHTVGERSTVVGALGRGSVELTLDIGDENLDGVVAFTGEGELLHFALSNIFGRADADTLFRHVDDR